MVGVLRSFRCPALEDEHLTLAVFIPYVGCGIVHHQTLVWHDDVINPLDEVVVEVAVFLHLEHHDACLCRMLHEQIGNTAHHLVEID